MNRLTAITILGILSAGLTLESYAYEGRSPKGLPAGRQGHPLIYEYNLYGPATIESDAIETTGTIKSIYAYYEFEGEVRLIVSANGGSHYVNIVNGEILKDKFIAGSQLRYKIFVGKDSLLKKLYLGYTNTSGANRLYHNPDLASYKSRKEIHIAGGSEEVFNYPLKIELGSQLAVLGYRNLASTEHRPPSSEIYFTAADGQTPLYYYIEEGSRLAVLGSRDLASTEHRAPSTEDAIFWVKIPQIPKEGTMIYMYYGEASVSGSRLAVIAENRTPQTEHRNNGNRVFPFFDDFSGSELDSEKWEVRPCLKEDYEVKDGYLRLYDTSIISRNYKLKDGIIEFKAKADEHASIQAIIRGEDLASPFSLEQLVYSSGYPGAEHAIAINGIAKLNIGKRIKNDTDYIYKVKANGSGIIFERYDEYYKKEANIEFLDMGGLDEGYIGLRAGNSHTDAGSVYFDYIRVRPYIKKGDVSVFYQDSQPEKTETSPFYKEN